MATILPREILVTIAAGNAAARRCNLWRICGFLQEDVLALNYLASLAITDRNPQVNGHLRISFNTLRPRQNGRRFADDSLKCIFLNENVSISIKISLKCDSKGTNNNIPALVQMIAWRRPGNKPLSEPMMVSFPTHICVTRPQWVRKCRHVSLVTSLYWLNRAWLKYCSFPAAFKDAGLNA